jgi:hypothetical protein
MCLSCFRKSKKLVHILINKFQCPFCYSDNCQEILFAKGNNNNYEIDTSSLKTNTSSKEDELMQSNNSSNNNLYRDFTLNQNENNPNKEKIKNSFLCKKKLFENIKPFNVSPFSKSVHRHEFDVSEILEGGDISSIPYDFFADNYCSNFVSNFDNPLGRMIFIQMQIKNNSKIKTNNPLNPKEIRQIKKFEMSDIFCKKIGSDLELPNCIYCLKDILFETEFFLLRCGHLIHDSCLFEWLKEHKICPVCKFYLVKKGSLRKSSLDLIIDDSIKEKEKIEKIFPYKTSENNSDCNMDELNASDDISKLINEENNNINIIGEKIRNMDFFLGEE